MQMKRLQDKIAAEEKRLQEVAAERARVEAETEGTVRAELNEQNHIPHGVRGQWDSQRNILLLGCCCCCCWWWW